MARRKVLIRPRPFMYGGRGQSAQSAKLGEFYLAMIAMSDEDIAALDLGG